MSSPFSVQDIQITVELWVVDTSDMFAPALEITKALM
jgi:hypothetical protein